MTNPTGYNHPFVKKHDGTSELHGVLDIKTATGGTLKVDGEDVSAGLQEIANLNGLSSADVAGIEALLLTCGDATIAAASAEAADARTVSIQLKDHLGGDLAHRCVVQVYLSEDANGDLPGDGVAEISISSGTDGEIISADEYGATLVSEADGDLDVLLTDGTDSAVTVYLHVVLPTGKIKSSAAIAFADDTP